MDDAVDGEDEAKPCRDFLVRYMLASLSPADREGLFAALHSANGMQLFGGYPILSQFVGNRDIPDADATHCGAGSEVAMTLDLHVNAEELDRIGGVDFAAYDDKPITQIIDDERPENDNKFVKAKFALPERFRLAIDVGPGLVADLK